MTTKEKTFSGRLKEAMTVRGMTSDELSARVDGAFSARTIFRWRSGATAPGVEALPLLTRQLDVSADWLIGASQLGGPEGQSNDQGDEQRDEQVNGGNTD